jgi:lysophospholipase L1-like esterase
MSSVVIEAEDMNLFAYQVESGRSPASGGKLITLANGLVQGIATTRFRGSSGIYNVVIGYFDENDGRSSLSVQVGSNLASVRFDQNLGSGGVSDRNLVRRTLFEGIQLTAGEPITLTGTVDENEFARIDYIEFIPAGNSSTPGRSQPISSPPPTTVVEPPRTEPIVSTSPASDLGTVLVGGKRNSVFSGDDGIETVSYAQATGGVVANLNTGDATRNFSPSPNQPLKLLAVGDSLTYGVINSKTAPYDENSGGYRLKLAEQFAQDGLAQAIDFVGSQRSGPDTFDNQHEGHRSKDINFIYNKIGNWLKAEKPNVVLLMVGTNDMKQNNAGTASDRLSKLIDQTAKYAPNAHILVSSLPPIPRDATQQAFAEAYNQKLPGIVSEKLAKGIKVSFVDAGSKLSAADIADGVHPTAEGYQKIADSWYGWLQGGKDSLTNIDNLVGSAYDDTLTGNAGVNILQGGAGNDRLDGSGGSDLLYGNAGTDTFVLAAGNGTDTIADFEVGKDLLGLAGGLNFNQISIASANGNRDTAITLAGSNEAIAILSGVQSTAITASSFTLV